MARATIIAAVIGAIGIVVAAWIGVQFGEARGERQALATATIQQATTIAAEIQTDEALEVVEASTPRPTNTPEFTPTDTPEPTPTNTPRPTNTSEPTPTNTPEPTPTNTPEPLPPGTFVDEFDVLSGENWDIIDPGFATSNGKLFGRGFIFRPVKDTNSVIKLRVQGSDFDVLFRSEGRSHGYNFTCEETNCVWQKHVSKCGNLGCIVNDNSSLEANREEFGFDTKNFHDLTITIKGSDFSLDVDGKNMLNTADQQFEVGRIGINSREKAFFDRVEIRPLP